ncbi:conserved hypothetical protein [Desulfonatronospira thiodismutans ASO3-1]|uniref:Uncharacterized protein n=1 Tax=Desulfonatronospira thiodismutans ASO3-1 TaxID=555779 RepID=D6SSG6_9BACT|nr:conserved hypothetical protein [Desulfonatronospira thiodismutans ASO3-1]
MYISPKVHDAADFSQVPHLPLFLWKMPVNRRLSPFTSLK